MEFLAATAALVAAAAHPEDGDAAWGNHAAEEFFAASLLMPRPWLDRFGHRLWRRGDVAELAREFGVTKIAAAVRLDELYGRSCLDLVAAGELANARYASA